VVGEDNTLNPWSGFGRTDREGFTADMVPPRYLLPRGFQLGNFDGLVGFDAKTPQPTNDSVNYTQHIPAVASGVGEQGSGNRIEISRGGYLSHAAWQ
jgi:hypothetical protein